MSRSVYQLGNLKFRADVQVGRLRKTKSFVKKSEAKKWAVLTEQDLLLCHQTELALSAPVAVVSLFDALSVYAREVSPSKRTARSEQKMIARFQRELPNVNCPVAEYRSFWIQQWQDGVMGRAVRPLKANSVLRLYSTLGDFFSWCVKRKWIRDNPLKDVEKPSAGEHRERRIELWEAEAILSQLGYKVGAVPVSKSEQVGLIFMIALATGMRSGEMVNRLVSEVDLAKKVVVIPQSKNGSRRVVPLDDFAVFLWRLALQRERGRSDRVFSVNDGSRDALFRKARDRAGIVNLTFHDTRHESASLMARRLANPLTLCKVFGWKDVKRALTYYNPTAQEISAELNGSAGLGVFFKSA